MFCLDQTSNWVYFDFLPISGAIYGIYKIDGYSIKMINRFLSKDRYQKIVSTKNSVGYFGRIRFLDF